MLIWDVKLRDKVLVKVTDEPVAKALCELLNSGKLYGVEGDPAAYEDARGPRMPDTSEATAEPERKPRKRL